VSFSTAEDSSVSSAAAAAVSAVPTDFPSGALSAGFVFEWSANTRESIPMPMDLSDCMSRVSAMMVLAVLMSCAISPASCFEPFTAAMAAACCEGVKPPAGADGADFVDDAVPGAGDAADTDDADADDADADADDADADDADADDADADAVSVPGLLPTSTRAPLELQLTPTEGRTAGTELVWTSGLGGETSSSSSASSSSLAENPAIAQVTYSAFSTSSGSGLGVFRQSRLAPLLCRYRIIFLDRAALVSSDTSRSAHTMGVALSWETALTSAL